MLLSGAEVLLAVVLTPSGVAVCVTTTVTGATGVVEVDTVVGLLLLEVEGVVAAVEDFVLEVELVVADVLVDVLADAVPDACASW